MHRLLTTLAAVSALAAVTLGALTPFVGGRDAQAAVARGSAEAAATPARPPAASLAAPRRESARPAQVRAERTPRSERGRHTLVAAAGAAVSSRPGGAVRTHVPMTTQLGAPTWLAALRISPNGRHALVSLPDLPNGRTGWIRIAGRRTVTSAVAVRADLSERRVTLMRAGRAIATFSASIGAPGSPTPTGRFSVSDLVATGDPNGSFGWYAFGLTGRQPNLPAGWSGGNQLAIHGTNDPSSIGRPASAGCLRVSAHALGVLKRHLRLGTPVVIHP